MVVRTVDWAEAILVTVLARSLESTAAQRPVASPESDLSVALVSHRGGNIGHDVMALGVETCVRAAFGVARAEITHPFQLYARWHPVRLLDHRTHGKSLLPKRVAVSQRAQPLVRPFLDPRHRRYDAAIVCGGPAIHPGAGHSPDMVAMYLNMLEALRDLAVPILNLSVGSCYPLERVPDEIPDVADREFHRRLLDLAQETTVRDEVAQTLYRGLGRDLPLIADTGLAAGEALESLFGVRDPRYVVLNVQRRGANEDWGQGVDPGWWQETAAKVVQTLSSRHELVFVCHADEEERLAAALSPNAIRLRPRTMEDYARVVSGAVAGLTNRIHAAIALASVGVPSVVVGTDTRLGTVETLGLRTFFVKDATAEALVDAVETTLSKAASERERLLTLRLSTIDRYARVIRRVPAR
jgi:hypothetical protein